MVVLECLECVSTPQPCDCNTEQIAFLCDFRYYISEHSEKRYFCVGVGKAGKPNRLKIAVFVLIGAAYNEFHC
jgi:hypothetical protein